MRATVLHGAKDVRLTDVADPRLRHPTDAVVRVVAACVCGSDLWPYRGIAPTERPRRIGHEFVGIVEEVGAEVRTVKAGDFVIAPFAVSDGDCVHCRNGVHTSCVRGGYWGGTSADGEAIDGAQAEYVVAPFADGTLVATAEVPDAAMIPSLLSLSDVMGTGHHAARAAGVGPGSTVAVVGDGAVGLCATLAASRLGAERIIVMSRHDARQRVARRFGATDIVTERGDEGAARVKDLLGGIGADAVLECVGTKESMQQSLDSTRPGGRVGYVGVPAGGPELPVSQIFRSNIGVAGGVAPVRAYIEELLADVLSGKINPGLVFDAEYPLAEVAGAYAAMDAREVIKPLLRP
ncbi:Threonine dehydrogenase and related Zn-dependent dehydrogenases [Alloactinosynnema sp. L-07]|uniref:zinc-dependent alcohol dehydrogenase family protein n=1 Tax=Alloactinosynnema sp. L-07 TaxID=1653480 RepID=UPI00065F02AD|nr:zinc-dependent alcohol dehydrogenase family protein [Alloactinosynnema sp. L-07]CRK58091.1 Threonine dehydrogenase and related Zn-dependent dehydrogenases [Alloactinosynnema sp. L-07]